MDYRDVISKVRTAVRDFPSNQLVTMKSVKKLDKNIYLLDYRNDYHIDEQHGEDRIAAVIKTLKAKNCVLDETQAMDLLSHVKLNYIHDKHHWLVSALWSAVYNTETGFLRLAANRDYKKIYTFNVSEPCKVHNVEVIEKSEYFDTLWSH